MDAIPIDIMLHFSGNIDRVSANKPLGPNNTVKQV